jgi:hypothetical protein
MVLGILFDLSTLGFSVHFVCSLIIAVLGSSFISFNMGGSFKK